MANGARIALLLAAFSCGATELATDDAWLVGHWHVVSEEDHEDSALGEVLAFLPGGAVVIHDSDCDPANEPVEVSYRTDGDDVVVTNRLPGEDHRVLVFRASRDADGLALTWPDTGKWARLERVPTDACVAR